MSQALRHYILPTSVALVAITACSKILGLDDPTIVGLQPPDATADEGGSPADGPTGDAASAEASDIDAATDAARQADADAGFRGAISSSLANARCSKAARRRVTRARKIRCFLCAESDGHDLGHAAECRVSVDRRARARRAPGLPTARPGAQ